MPIYAYKCEACGHAQDVLRKISDPPLDTCPQCGASAFVKQVTAAGFQLKGSGWYVTDFRGGKATGSSDQTASSDAKSGASSDVKTDRKPEATVAPAVAAAPPASASKKEGSVAAPAASTGAGST